MAKLTIPELLTKLSNVFKKDMYIIQSLHCIGGDSSESENAGKAIVTLDKDMSDSIKDYFGDSAVIYFNDIKKAKAAFDTEEEYLYIKISMEEKDKKAIFEKRDSLLKIVQNISDWKHFNFTDNQLKALFDDSEMILLFSDNPDIPEVYITKSLFPLVTRKDITNLYYSAFKTRNIKNTYTLVTSFDFDYFQVYNIFYYLKMEKKKKKKAEENKDV